jgi:hypothetical protein
VRHLLQQAHDLQDNAREGRARARFLGQATCDSEDIRNEWIAVFRRLGIDVAKKLGASEEEYLDAWFAGIEIHGDALKARLARKVRRLEEQQARARRAEHCAVPALLCDTADQKGLKRSLAVEASVTGDMHLESLEIRRGGVLEVRRAAHLTHRC